MGQDLISRVDIQMFVFSLYQQFPCGKVIVMMHDMVVQSTV
jgi:hypothetical protein